MKQFEAATSKEVDSRWIVLAGAGVSAGEPTLLPGWKPLNRAIARALQLRIESATGRKGWLAQVEAIVDEDRGADRFPPEYQAQLIEEACGDRYFRGLQSLDIDVTNAAHEGIASLAAAGKVRAIVTTNFDRLIERALTRRGIRYRAAFDDDGFVNMGRALQGGSSDSIPVIKIHGCVSDHRSMIDTLKQRRCGRSLHLQQCLEPLFDGRWLYAGFSAADLDGDESYLGLVPGAAHSLGATFIAYPRNPELGVGAQRLMQAHGDRGTVVVAPIATYLSELLGKPTEAGPSNTSAPSSGASQFESRLAAWAESLPLASAGLCFAAVLEGVGQAEPAVRILDRLVRHEIYDDRDTEDYRLLQLAYGRLGAAYGRFVAVPDINGQPSNASVETLQSLLRIARTELGFAAQSWLAPAFLWIDQGGTATSRAKQLLLGILTGRWEGPTPRTDEEVADAWICATQVLVIDSSEDAVGAVAATYERAVQRGRQSGDVVRVARVMAMYLLALAETSENVPSLARERRLEFAEAERVGDRFALAMRELALGRWHVGAGGIALTRGGESGVAERALMHLNASAEYLQNQNMDPWILFAEVQRVKALADVGRYDLAYEELQRAVGGLDRFPVLASHVHEVDGQLCHMHGDPDFEDSFRKAIDSAAQSGLAGRVATLTRLFELTRAQRTS